MKKPMTPAEKIKKAIHHLLYKNKTIERVFQRLSLRIIRISPFFWVQEGLDLSQPPVLKDNPDHYTYGFIGMDELDALMAFVPDYSEAFLTERFKTGKKCFAIKYRGEIAAFQWFNLEECTFKANQVRLSDREVYLFDMRTANEFRGKNLAPCLRYEGYLALKKMGRDTFYSTTDYFNLPAVRFKEKLKSKILWLALYVELFRRFDWRWILKRYP